MARKKMDVIKFYKYNICSTFLNSKMGDKLYKSFICKIDIDIKKQCENFSRKQKPSISKPAEAPALKLTYLAWRNFNKALKK